MIPALRVVGERHGNPVMTWHRSWLSLLQDFAQSNPQPTTRVKLDWYQTGHGACPDEVFDLNSLPYSVLRRLLALGESMWSVRLIPDSGLAHLSEITQPLNGTAGRFFAALKEAIVVASGEETSCLNVPTGMGAGSEDGSFPIHTDIFPGRYLFNVFEHPASNGQGASLLLSVDDYEPLIRQAFGDRKADEFLRIIRRQVPWGFNQYVEVFGYHDEPDDTGLIASTNAASLEIMYDVGEGYLVDDAVWMHGRTIVPAGEYPEGRMHRLTFDTEESLHERFALEGF